MNDDHHIRQDNSCHDESARDNKIKDSERKDQAKEQEQPTKGSLQQWRELSLDRKIESCIGLVGLLFAGILAGTAIHQLDAMQDQLTEIRNGSADTKAIAQSAVTQAENTRKLAETARTQLDLSQRPWVEPEFGVSTQLTLNNGRWEGRLKGVFINNGQSVALNVMSYTEMFPFDMTSQF